MTWQTTLIFTSCMVAFSRYFSEVGQDLYVFYWLENAPENIRELYLLYTPYQQSYVRAESIFLLPLSISGIYLSLIFS